LEIRLISSGWTYHTKLQQIAGNIVSGERLIIKTAALLGAGSRRKEGFAVFAQMRESSLTN
jgi:hypothetical protein